MTTIRNSKGEIVTLFNSSSLQEQNRILNQSPQTPQKQHTQI